MSSWERTHYIVISKKRHLQIYPQPDTLIPTLGQNIITTHYTQSKYARDNIDKERGFFLIRYYAYKRKMQNLTQPVRITNAFFIYNNLQKEEMREKRETILSFFIIIQAHHGKVSKNFSLTA